MRTLMSILLLVIVISSTMSDKITEEENRALKHDCGSHFLNDSRRHVRSIGGREAVKNEFPWIAALIKQRVSLDFPHWQIHKGLCSGVQISKKHILTAAHCVIRRRANLKCSMKIENKFRYDILQNSDFLIMAGSSCLDPDECLSTSTIYKPSEILVYPDYDPCQKTNDLALITVASSISRMDGSPVCMPKEKEMFVTKMTAVGFGVDPTKSLYQTKLRALLLDVYSYPQKALLKITSQGKSICAGDSGGPLVKVNSTNKYIVMGIIYATDTDCRTKHPRTALFTNFFDYVPGYIEWICMNSGVCPIENAQPTK